MGVHGHFLSLKEIPDNTDRSVGSQGRVGKGPFIAYATKLYLAIFLAGS